MARNTIKGKSIKNINGSAVSQTGNIEQDSIDQLGSRINKLDKQVSFVEKNLSDRLTTEVSKFEDKVRDREIRTTEILAIFITLFTFISVNISIFTRVLDLQAAIWFMGLITVFCMILISCLFLLISKEKNWYSISILLTSLVFMIGLLVATNYTPSWNLDLNKIESVDLRQK